MCAALTFQYATEHFNLGNAVRISMEMILNLVPYSKICVVQQGFQERSAGPCAFCTSLSFRNTDMQIFFATELSAKKSDHFPEIALRLLLFELFN
jgi:hypothetical protein